MKKLLRRVIGKRDWFSVTGAAAGITLVVVLVVDAVRKARIGDWGTAFGDFVVAVVLSTLVIPGWANANKRGSSVQDSGAVKKLHVEVAMTGGYGEDLASIKMTDDNGTVLLTELSHSDVQGLASMLGRHVPYTTLHVAD